MKADKQVAYQTPSQHQKETGEPYPDGWPVWVYYTGDCWVGEHWGFVESYGEVRHIHEDEDIICAVSIVDAPPIGKAEDENE